MPKFRKKPVVIEAERFWPDGLSIFGVYENGAIDCGMHHWVEGHHVHTLEGPLSVSPGDWIITGVKGERYPIKDEIFRETYEPTD